MAKLTNADVTHVAKLASLKLTSDEVDKFREQLSKIIDYINELSEVNASGLEPTSQTTGLENVKRRDVITEGLTQDEAVSQAVNIYNGYFKVSAILTERKAK